MCLGMRACVRTHGHTARHPFVRDDALRETDPHGASLGKKSNLLRQILTVDRSVAGFQALGLVMVFFVHIYKDSFLLHADAKGGCLPSLDQCFRYW